MTQPRKGSSFLQFALLFAVIYLTTQVVMQTFFPEKMQGPNAPTGVVLSMQDDTVKGQHHPVAIIRNLTDQPLRLPSRCPQPPFDVFRIMSPDSSNEEMKELTAERTATKCNYPLSIAAGKTEQISLDPWKYEFFDDYGTYQLELVPNTEKGGFVPEETVSTRFSIYEPGGLTKLFRAFITKPLLNLLIFIADVLPGHNLGVAIIILTIIIKLILFVPTQHALEGQKKLQAVQPKIDEIRKKYKGDPQRMNQETMKLWKKEKINPFQSCMPMLLQFPVLIGLFFVIRDGSQLELSRHLIYSMYQDLSWTWGTQFFGLDLLTPSTLFFPPVLVISQFIQMKLSFAIANKKKQNKEKVVDVTPEKKKKDKKKEEPSMQETQQKVMMYGLPFMIGFFALKFPAAVALYWWVSTLFAIGQQLVVNRKEL